MIVDQTNESAMRPKMATSLLATLVMIAVAIGAVNMLIAPDRFADHYSYLVLTDQLYYFNGSEWSGYEIASQALLLGLKALLKSTLSAVNAAHFILGLSFILFVFHIAVKERLKWQGILIVFALYGPLLAFVTIRATPAYFLVTIATLQACRGRVSAIPVALLALLFHVSAILALPPLAVALAQNRYSWFSWVRKAGGTVILLAIVYVGAFSVFRSTITAGLTSAVGAVPFLNKYVVYLGSIDPLNSAQVEASSRSITHLIYLAVVSVFFVVFLRTRDERSDRLKGFLIISYLIFLFLQFSPVSAFRQSQFWMMPALFVFPWDRYVRSGARAVLLVIGCSVVAVLNILGVYL